MVRLNKLDCLSRKVFFRLVSKKDKPGRGKQSSLFQANVVNEEKRFIILTPDVVMRRGDALGQTLKLCSGRHSGTRKMSDKVKSLI